MTTSGHGGRGLGGAAAAALLLSGCAGAPPPAPAVAPAPPRVAPAPPPPPPRAAPDWRDLPLTPGEWTYSGDGAGGPAAAFAGAALLLRCDPARREVALVRTGAAGPLTVRTSYGAASVAAALPAADPRLDEIAFSRGRFTVEAEGLPTLVVPAWAEPARVIEDCRG